MVGRINFWVFDHSSLLLKEALSLTWDSDLKLLTRSTSGRFENEIVDPHRLCKGCG